MRKNLSYLKKFFSKKYNMPLSETRIVLFEKAGFKKNFHALFEEIEMHINDSKKMRNKCIYVSQGWVEHKLVKKILQENGYKIIVGKHDAKIEWD